MKYQGFNSLACRSIVGSSLAALLVTSAMVAPGGAQEAGGIEDTPLIFEDITGDGRYMIGNGFIDGYTRGSIHHRLPQSSGAQGIGSLGGSNSFATAISADGPFVAGYSRNADRFERAIRWTYDGGMEDLGTLMPLVTNMESRAWGISADGTRVVGQSSSPGVAYAFVWIEDSQFGVSGNEQMYRLYQLDGHTEAIAHAISDDGRFAAGRSGVSQGIQRAVRWDLSQLGTEDGEAEILNLGSLIGMDGWSASTDISGDGRVVVGSATTDSSVIEAFIWREGYDGGVEANRQMSTLGTLGGTGSGAMAVSRDGQYVVGWANDADQEQTAFRWSEIEGMESVAAWLGRHGVDVGDRVLEIANAITDDGNVIVGKMEVRTHNGTEYRGFIARVVPTDPGENPGGDPDPDPGPGLMDVKEYHDSLGANASLASTGEFLSWLPLNGAHHRPLAVHPTLGDGNCVWATGDFARHNGDQASLGLAEIGGCLPVLDQAVVGFGVGASHAWQDLDRGGDAEFGGYYAMGEIDWQPAGTPLVFSLTGVAGHWDVDIRRGYSNGAATDYSVGETDAQGAALRARVDWLDAATFGNTSLNPFASVGFSTVHVDGYTETGGAFPARFDGQTVTSREVRLGLSAVTEIAEAATLTTTLEAVHRSGDAPGTSGVVPGVFGFDLGGGSSSQNWVRAGAELDFAITESAVLSASFNAATAGGDATVSGSLGLRAQF